MSTGHAEDTMAVMRALPGRDWVRVFFDVPLVYPPGTHFLYNSGASFVLSAALQARAGMTLGEYIRPRLLQPLGIAAPPWAASPQGISLGASGLRLRTEDLAKFGLLYLQRGCFRGKQLLPAEWVDRATASHIATRSEAPDWAQGYGYQFWRSTYDSFRADGAYGQFSLVLPGHDAVIAITAGNRDNWRIPPVVWDSLLPGLLPDGGAAGTPDVRLEASLSDLVLPGPGFISPPSPRETELAAKVIVLKPNVLGLRTVRFYPAPSRLVVELSFADGTTESAPAGHATWLSGQTALWPYDEPGGARVASQAGWIDQDTLGWHQQCIDTAFQRIWRFQFAPDGEVSASVQLDMPYWRDHTEYLAGRLETA
jgi:hypothetical protein